MQSIDRDIGQIEMFNMDKRFLCEMENVYKIHNYNNFWNVHITFDLCIL